MSKGKAGWKRWTVRILLALIVLILPPILISATLVTLVVIQDYNGICPGIMDIPDYECTIWEFAARNSTSPFALPVHMLIFLAYFAIAFPGITAVLIWKWLNEKERVQG